MRHERPSFDDLEAPAVVTTPIDGLTDEQWARRNERRAQVIRLLAGIVFGLAVGSLAVVRLNFTSSHFFLASWFVMGGAMLLFVLLFTGTSHGRFQHYLEWVLFPEWKILESLPLWLIALVGLAAIAVLALAATFIVIGYFPRVLR